MSEPFHILAVAEELGMEMGRRRRQEWLARCPLHDDRHPSLRLNPEKGTWFCDPCGRGGGTVALIEAVLGCSRREAARWLRQRDGGASLPARLHPPRPPEPPKPVDLDTAAAQRRLEVDPEAQAVLARRGLSENSWRDLEVGLVLRHGRRCLCFPMFQLSGPSWRPEIVGFRLRPVVRSEGEPKARTEAGHRLGVFVPRSHSVEARETHIVEGEMDLAALLTAAPSANALATPGTALSREIVAPSLAFLCSGAERIILWSQGDEPSRRWAAALCRLLGPSRCRVRVAPPGVDVNDWLVEVRHAA